MRNMNRWRMASLTTSAILSLFVPRGAHCLTPQELTGPTNLSFGASVALSGNTAVVGAPSYTGGYPGAAYVFTRTSRGWVQAAILTPSDVQAYDEFGLSVSISGDDVVVGAPRHMLATYQQGVAYVFVKPPAGWSNMTETAKLSAPDAQPVAYFGLSVAISGNAILVGSPEQTIDGMDDRGAAYIFVEPKAGWTTTSQSTNEFIVPNSSELGWTVALDAGTAVASAPGNGVAFLYAKPPNGWSRATLTAELTTSTPDFQDFGAFTAIRGETICVGAMLADNGIGAAYVYQEPSGGWQNMTQTAILTPSDGVLVEEFGVSVSLSNSTIAVGAGYDDSGAGAVYLYSEPIDGWQNATENQKLLPPSGQHDFGHSVFLNYSTLFIGADDSSDVFVY